MVRNDGRSGQAGLVEGGDADDARTALRTWFGHRRMAYPWRVGRALWPALVAELMLHQTQMSRALPAYERFMAAYPTPKAFADADDDAVRVAWDGLGYYRRGFMLREAALELVAHPDDPPTDLEALRALPGVGPYTAAILASTVFDEPVAAIDGNVTRVVARVFSIRGATTDARFKREVEDSAKAFLDTSDPGAWNEALMDLGRTVCTPRAPSCHACPLVGICTAHRAGTHETIPPVKHQKRTTVHVAIGVVEHPAGLLVEERPDSGLLARQNAFPTGEGESPAEARAVLEAHLQALLGRELPTPTAMGRDEHVFSHRHWKATVWQYSIDGSTPRLAAADEARWVPKGRMGAQAMPALYARVAGRVAGPQARLRVE